MSLSLGDLSPDDCVLCDESLQEQIIPGRELPELPITEADQSAQANELYDSRLEPLEAWQIRVLEVFPPKNNPGIEGKLWTADMLHDRGVLLHGSKTRVEYSAISYHWGEDRRLVSIVCNGVDYPITLQAYRALQRTRVTFTQFPVYLWIDSICINQHNLAERAIQVTKMVSIFSKAETVFAYLGEPQTPNWKSPALCVFSWLRCQRGICYNHLLSVVPQGLVELSTPWFHRLWIRQEIWSATAVHALYGPQQLDWEVLRNARYHLSHVEERMRPESPTNLALVDAFYKKVESLARSDPVQQAMTRMPDRRRDTNAAHNYSYRGYFRTDKVDPDYNLNVFNVLRSATEARCERTEDRIYGLLGMCRIDLTSDHNAGPRQFFVSYEEAAVVVFARLAKYLISRDRSLDLLRLRPVSTRVAAPTQGEGIVREGQRLPSWVPNWTMEYELPNPNDVDSTDEDQLEKSALDLPAQHDHLQLRLEGYGWGKLVSRSKARDQTLLTFHWSDHLPIQSEESDADIAIPSVARSGDLLVRAQGYYWFLIVRPTIPPSVEGSRYCEFVTTLDPASCIASKMFSKAWFSRGCSVDAMEKDLQLQEIILV